MFSRGVNKGMCSDFDNNLLKNYVNFTVPYAEKEVSWMTKKNNDYVPSSIYTLQSSPDSLSFFSLYGR